MSTQERDIKTISFGRACRDRLGMYLSADKSEALHLGLREIYVNSLDALTETNQPNGVVIITIDSKKHEVEVQDTGPGIPIKTRDDGSYSLVAAYSLSHTGSHFDGRATNAIGTNGVGGSIVNHTASYFEVLSCDGKKMARAIFEGSEEGAQLKDYHEAKPDRHSGVKVLYQPDSLIYGDEWFNREALVAEFSEMMKFYPKYKLILQMDDYTYSFAYPKGLRENDTCIYYESESLIMALNANGGGIKAYGNRLYLPNGGAFFTQFKTQLTKIVNDLSGLKLKGEQVQAVFGGYLAIFVNNPLFSNQSKTAISNKEVNPEITSALRSEMEKFVKTSAWDKIVKNLEAEAKAEAAAERAREKVLKAKKDFADKKINTMSEKFIDTDRKDRANCDLYLAEGDSAGGPIKRTKPDNAAVMLLRGKVLNTARTDFEAVLNNKELMMIAKGIGATLTETGFLLPEQKMRFGKIIIAADSDEDGCHIQSLLMAYFYTYFPQLIRKGMLYALAPKLFKIETKGKEMFFGSELEMNTYVKANKIRAQKVQRFKGLGSFDDSEFKAQIDPETRDLIQITIPSAARAAQAMKLMEEEVKSRKDLIRGEFEWEE